MSSLENVLQTLAVRLQNHSETIATEEAAKTSVVLPFLQALGYDVFNPSEVVPEFTADTVGKKGEKVDYAVKLDGEIKVLIECKGLNTALDRKHLSQLYRYFSVTKAKFAILTNGRVYEFYSDLEEPNKLDVKPFFSFDLMDQRASSLAELKKFQKSAFDESKILATAERLKYTSAIKTFLSQQMEQPGEALVKLVASEVYDGRVTSHVREMVQEGIQVAFRDVIRDAVQARLSSALERDAEHETVEEAPSVEEAIETTRDEIEGMLTIRAIVRDVIDAHRIDLRDAKSYCAVLVDDNNRKPLARLHFNRKQWYLGLFDQDHEERVAIADLNDMFRYAGRLRVTAEKYKDS
ncbi:type I restriction endonuclease [Pseudodonghicola xiamenensis]|uniref:Restriction endonuclease or methylase n=1 Tax=Pseudodonghicola xiamenensis TaxID=337702 RepID=A0A8J3H8G2_9RHOB|nr:type I restriction endonuclease [Pseudodonghicola xiamenensis]GHH00089.1 restriction endonuclease or methylase [Pseudodonghicola xiamenensis]